MKRYLLFGFDDFYPSGGWDDFLQSFDTLEQLKACAYHPDHSDFLIKFNVERTMQDFDNYQIIDLHTGKEVKIEL